jgi:SAM-dependent methyltransferase
MTETQMRGPGTGLGRFWRGRVKRDHNDSDAHDQNAEIEKCLAGEKLYGDDFPLEAAAAWLKEEEDGYYKLGHHDRANYTYNYHALNWHHSFSFLPDKPYAHILGVGGAYGDELRVIAAKARRITVLEPCSHFVVSEICGVPTEYVKPRQDGRFPFTDGVFDLITSFSVIHHLPYVSVSIQEIYRCLAPGGYALIREPIISMGDWRKPRKGVTAHQRGIPLPIFRKMILSSGFEIVRERKCCFSLTSRLRYLLSKPVYNSRVCVFIDAWLCRLPVWPDRYHPRHALHKLRPWAASFVLRKTAPESFL